MSERPKRTIRKPTRLLDEAADTPPLRTKRKAQQLAIDDNASNALLTSPKSALTTMDISDLINANTWAFLSNDSKTSLAKLLPPTAFSDYQRTIDPDHPSRKKELDSNAMIIDTPQHPQSSYEVERLFPSVFTDPHFLSAAHTFQDHLYSGWLKEDFKAKVAKYEEGIRDGTLAAPWKDEEWEKEHPLPENNASKSTSSSTKSRGTGGAVKAGIYDLAHNSVIEVGDIISYKRNFSALDVVIEKDVLVHSINMRTRSFTVLLEPGPTQYLPPYLLMPDRPDPVPPIQSMEITSPTMLETGILDVDGRVERGKRPNGNAWKVLTVYRWREGIDPSMDDNRGGRESHGTLHYLRNSHFSDS
ncbi:Asx homology domain-containing protein [Lentinula aciculospora]|uniref:Asx homology domain-containing protein n=1 Tax=Lentinula aciculospora TaxID=153920 RepID=A0A9W9DEK7_9AGAR|nr:Asx homology domain-containing protein [Lentinula aciculospora]